MMNVTDANASEMLKESSLETIGYICLDIVSSVVFILLLRKLMLNNIFNSIATILEPRNFGITKQSDPDCHRQRYAQRRAQRSRSSGCLQRPAEFA